MPKRFRFPLQKVLDVRRHLENQKALELNVAQNKLLNEKQRLESLKKRKEVFLDDTGNQKRSKKFIRLNDIRVSGSYVEQLNDQIKGQNEVVTDSEKVVDKRRKLLVEAMKDKKMVEKLREHHLEKHKKESRRQELKIVDEIALRPKNDA